MTILNAAEVEGGEVGVLIKLLHNSELIEERIDLLSICHESALSFLC